MTDRVWIAPPGTPPPASLPHHDWKPMPALHEMIEETVRTTTERNRRMTVGHINDLRAASEAGTATHFGAESIMPALAADPKFTTTIVLGKGDTAWNPASTKGVLHGPGEVTYTQHPDGGIDAVERKRSK